jgi:hypothetical protein
MPSRSWVVATLLVSSCTDSPPPPDPCSDGKCDLPDDPAEVSCRKRRADAFNDNRLAFRENALRWSCADVQGVTLSDRGQEYCEYFAIVQPPSRATPSVLGRNLGPDSSYGTTPALIALTAPEIVELEASPDAVVGQCVFTSWNSDINDAPTCANATCPPIAGVAVDETTFRMKFDVNSAEAAQILVEDCLTMPTPGDPYDATDPRHDPFLRGCLWNAELNETEFRKSDTMICSSMTRAAECGCRVDAALPLGELLSPWDRRGFPLGGWADATKLPPSCRFVQLDDMSQTIVTCDLNARDLVDGAADVKAACATKYADNIVVHVPIDPAVLVCEPNTSSSPYADSCSATPWVVTPY